MIIIVILSLHSPKLEYFLIFRILSLGWIGFQPSPDEGGKISTCQILSALFIRRLLEKYYRRTKTHKQKSWKMGRWQTLFLVASSCASSPGIQMGLIAIALITIQFLDGFLVVLVGCRPGVWHKEDENVDSMCVHRKRQNNCWCWWFESLLENKIQIIGPSDNKPILRHVPKFGKRMDKRFLCLCSS